MLDPIEHLREMEAQWNRAYLSGGVEGFSALLDKDFVYSSERGVFRKDACLSNPVSGVIEMRRLENIHSEILLHDDVTVSIGTVLMEASFRREDISGQDRFTRIWISKNSVWKAIAQHANAKVDTDS